MDQKKVEKNIGQMRGIFAFTGVISFIVVIINLLNGGELGLTLLLIIFTIIFFMAFYGLGKRTKIGRTFAIMASILLLLSFPILTIFGIIYLRKLSKQEMIDALLK